MAHEKKTVEDIIRAVKRSSALSDPKLVQYIMRRLQDGLWNFKRNQAQRHQLSKQEHRF